MSPASQDPSPDHIHAALDALRDDATAWTDAAHVMRAAAGKALESALPPAAFSFAGGAIAATYELLRAKTTELLVAGAGNFDDVAVALVASAAAYEADEAAHAHHFNHIY